MSSKDDQLTNQEFEKLCNTAKNPREQLIMRLAGEGGMRVSEITHLKKQWINFQNQEIHIPSKDQEWTPKTPAGARTIPFYHLPQLEILLKNHFTLLKQEDGIQSDRSKHPSRQSIHKMIKKRATEAGITHRVYPHALRSTAAQKYIVDLEFEANPLRTVMGWERLTTAEAYITRSGKSVRQAIEKATRRQT